MSDSTPRFPLTKRGDGRWCKKVCGKMLYFSGTAEEALDQWHRVKDDAQRGRPVVTVVKDGATVEDACNHFLAFKDGQRIAGELAQRSYDRLQDAAQFLADTLGKRRQIAALGPHDFQELREKMAALWGPTKRGVEIGIVRSLFRHAVEIGLVDRPVQFGPNFRKPSEKVLRQTRNERGPRMFEPPQIVAILRAADDAFDFNLRAMILLGINGGMGNTDVAELTVEQATAAVASGWLNYPRSKTGVGRRVPLWPETVLAIDACIRYRRKPRRTENAHLAFIGERGGVYTAPKESSHGGRVSERFAALAKKAGIAGRAFYDLRRTFQTIGEANDAVACSAIMGHAAAGNDMSARYRQRIDDARLRAVVMVVRAWLWS